jgi:hypothetical protein
MTDERTQDLPGTDTNEIDRDPARRGTRPPARPLDDGSTERVRLIEFVWSMHPGRQPVILVEREWLH